MSISGILSSSYNQNQLTGSGSNYQQQIQQLSQDLTSGNLSAAQSDFATLQAAFTQPSTSSPFSSASSTSNTTAQAFNQLATDLQSGNLPAAQKDIATVQHDLQTSNSRFSTNHLRHSNPVGGSGDSSSQNSPLQNLNQSSTSVTSGNFTSAQQVYSTLQQQLQQFSLGGGAIPSESPFSLQA
jgi:phage-related tail fiber protein